MTHPKVVFLGDTSKTAAADVLVSSSSRGILPIRIRPRNSTRDSSVVEIRSWLAARTKVSIWDYNMCERFAVVSHLLTIPGESVFVIWLEHCLSQEEIVQSAVRYLDEIHEHVTLLSAARVHVVFAMWLGRSGADRTTPSLSTASDCSRCCQLIANRVASQWPHFEDYVTLHNRVVLVPSSGRSGDELALFVGKAIQSIIETFSVSETQKVEKVSARVVELKRQPTFPILSWEKFKSAVNQNMRHAMSSDVLLKVTTFLSATGQLLLIDKPGVPRHVIIDVDKAISWLSQLLTNTDIQRASADVGVTAADLSYAFQKYASQLPMVTVQLQELQLAFSAARDGSLLKLPTLHTAYRQRVDWPNLEGGEMAAALHLPVVCHSLFPTIQVVLGQKFGRDSFFVWKSSCRIDHHSGRALVVCACRDHEMTVAWTVCASNEQPVSEFWSSLSTLLQGHCTHHIPGISFQLESNLMSQEFAALAVASENDIAAPPPTNGVSGSHSADGNSSPVDPGHTAEGRKQEYQDDGVVAPPLPPKGPLLAVVGDVSGGSEAEGSDSDDEPHIVVERPTMLIADLGHGFTLRLAEVLDSDTGRSNWERLAAGFHFTTHQVQQFRSLLANGPSNGPTKAILQAVNNSGQGTVEALGMILQEMGRDDMRKELDLAVERYVQSRTRSLVDRVLPVGRDLPPSYLSNHGSTQDCVVPPINIECPPVYSAIPDACYPDLGVTVRDSPRILICYFWEDDNHAEDVRKFCLALRKERFDARLDQFEKDRINAMGPVMWKAEEYEKAKFVLVVCSKSYCAAARGHITESPNHPFGSLVKFEYQNLMMTDVISSKNKGRFVIPILFDGHSGLNFFKVVPLSLQAGTGYPWPLKKEDLIFRLEGKERYPAPTIRPPPPLKSKVVSVTSQQRNDRRPPKLNSLDAQNHRN